VYQTLTNRLRGGLAAHIREKYGVELPIALERPPNIEMGEAASPVCFELAKRLKRAPRQIAQEIAGGLGKIEGIQRVEVAGGGYLNAYFDRVAFWTSARQEAKQGAAEHKPEEIQGARGLVLANPRKIIVEHTSVNPNKAAHIGHVRNAVLGDTMARTLRHAGYNVQIQNYIDNTGVQVADVVIGFLRMEQRSPIGVKILSKEPRFDYYCWDLYAKTTHFLEEDKARAAAFSRRAGEIPGAHSGPGWLRDHKPARPWGPPRGRDPPFPPAPGEVQSANGRSGAEASPSLARTQRDHS